MRNSSYSGFFKLPMEKRLSEVAEFASLTEEERGILSSADSLDADKADHMIENVIGKFALPMGGGYQLHHQRQGCDHSDGMRGTVSSSGMFQRRQDGQAIRRI